MNFREDTGDSKSLDNISLTAYRIISIFNMLMEEPYTEKEINEQLQHDIAGARSLSQDTIAIYINTLRVLGCKITRPSKSNNFKYEIKSHPFNIELDDNEINLLVKIRKYISGLNDWKLIVNVDRLYDTINQILNSESRKKLTQALKDCLRDLETTYESQLVGMLEKYCKKSVLCL